MLKKLNRLLAFAAALFTGFGLQAQMPEGANRTMGPSVGGDKAAVVERATRRRTLSVARQAAAARQRAALQAKGGQVNPAVLGTNPAAKGVAAKNAGAPSGSAKAGVQQGLAVPGPGFQLQQPDYMFGTATNWHNTKPIRKFVDGLPGIGAANANNLGAYIPVAAPDRATYPGADYYQINVVEYTQKLHSDLNPTKLRGYQDATAAAPTSAVTGLGSNYLGPIIVAKKDRPVRVKMQNMLPTGAAGNLFLPIDTTLMGAGLGPNGGAEVFTQNRAEFHLHGGLNPWISDGTPHQWITPAGEVTSYPKGAVFQNVPDMAAGASPTDGTATYFWSNQQSGRLMFYHDHAFGMTRLNVYAGEAAGYMIVDPTETKLINAGIIPSPGSTLPISDDPWDPAPAAGYNAPLANNVYTYGIPLVIQDKTFVDTSTMNMEAGKGVVGVSLIQTNPAQPDPSLPDHLLPVTASRTYDASGNVTNWALVLDALGNPVPATDPTWDIKAYGGDGSLWFPHVYMPNQNPADISGANAMGRWDYGPWFWPPLTTIAQGGTLTHGAEPVPGDPNGTQIPGTPNPSLTPESFMDTPVVNGTAYPTLTVNPTAYRFRILNAGNDRMLNLSYFVADATGTEVSMVPSAPNALWPTYWPTDGRAGGVPDPATAGPSFVQIGNESGFLPTPVVIPATPVGYNYNRRDIVVLNIATHGLLLGPAERADVIVDFSAFAGKTLILYNDAPAPVPAFDTRLDYYTGDPDQSSSGGAPTTLPGYGSNTRTVMQVVVNAAGASPAFDVAALNAAFTSTATAKGAFAEAQHLPIVPQKAYNAALNRNVTRDTWARIQDFSFYPNAVLPAVPGYVATENGTQINPSFYNKAIQELFELDYGRMNATLGVEIPGTNFNIQTTIPLGYGDPTTEFLNDGETQYWKITHNGVDTHPVHFHLFDVQVVNRVGWDGAVRFPDANELGWKDTVRMNPLEDVILAFRPLSPRLPLDLFGGPIANSLRSPDVLQPANVNISVTDPATGNAIISVPNAVQDFGWEYVWHCHILGHEENDFMRPVNLAVATTVPTDPTGLLASTLISPNRADLTWTDTSTNETGFSIQRRLSGGVDPFVEIATTVPNQNNYSDFSILPNTSYDYQVVAYNQAGPSGPTVPFVTVGAQPVTVSGLVYSVQAGVNVPTPGVTLTFTGSSPNAAAPNQNVVLSTTATYDPATGAYTTALPYNWTGTVTPTAAGFAFTPAILSLNGLITNLVSQNFVARPVAIISGTVLVGAAPLPGVTITLTNGGGAAVTDATGAYSVAVNSGWTGTATPALAGYLFAPASIAYATAVTIDTPLQNYAATAVITIGGTVTNVVTGLGEPGVLISLSTGQSTTTAADGSYLLSVPQPYTGTATPSKSSVNSAYVFSPAFLSYAGATVNQIAQNYSVQPVITLSGTVSSLPAGVNATLTFSTGQVVTTVGGFYSLVVNAPYTGMVTPSAPGLIFSPANAAFVAATTNQSANFLAQVQITGTILYNGAPLSGVTMAYTGGSVVSTASGYAITVPAGWSGTVTPSLIGYLFTNASNTYGPVNVSTVTNYTAIAGIEINGQVYINTLPITAVPNVSITFTGTYLVGAVATPWTATTLTDVNGFYRQFVPRTFTGTASATLAGYAFNPVNRNFNNVTNLQSGRNFIAIPQVTVTGQVTNFSFLGGLPVSITFSNGGGTVLTSTVNGTYSITLNAGWTGNITANLAGHTFTPYTAVPAITVNTAGMNFTAFQTISGRTRTTNGLSVNGVTVSLINADTTTFATAITAGNGAFTFQVPAGWSGSVTASGGIKPSGLPYTTWTPVGVTTYTGLSANATGLRFNGN